MTASGPPTQRPHHVLARAPHSRPPPRRQLPQHRLSSREAAAPVSQGQWQGVGKGRLRRVLAPEAALKQCKWGALALPAEEGFAVVGGGPLLHLSTACVDCEDALQALRQIVCSGCGCCSCCPECSSSPQGSSCANSNHGSVWASPCGSPALNPGALLRNAGSAALPPHAEGEGAASSPRLPTAAGSAEGPLEPPPNSPEEESLCSRLLGPMRRNLARLTSDGVTSQLLLLRFGCEEGGLLQEAKIPLPCATTAAAGDFPDAVSTVAARAETAMRAVSDGCKASFVDDRCTARRAVVKTENRDSGDDCSGRFSELLCCLLLLPIVEYRMRCGTDPEDSVVGEEVGSSCEAGIAARDNCGMPRGREWTASRLSAAPAPVAAAAAALCREGLNR
ncbi:hypothetical protein cyc_08046 [Cyclospora cayetanensis]|uniref:Uncharacterized protein n=1 Tax=Cyclospora cayetanensis TaxID=88456 RepID=A0A1D3D7X5_9EIME|nr:hypothetical protein cyc_08046 [Cyclospora cayetanensis]